jgi:mono/diheme cytochrome c family protein
MLATAALAQAPAEPRNVDALRAFFAQNCVRCHGLDGSARDPQGKKLKGKDFTDPKEMKGETDAELEKTIRKGVFFGKAMPAFGKELSEAEIKVFVKEIVRKAEKGKAIK